jgi:transcriptional regulator with XRE-family HTH domain
MREVTGLGRRQPDGGKVVKLRKQLGIKQEDLAQRAGMSVRHLREIERRNKAAAGTHITAIATALQVPPHEITLPASNAMSPDEDGRFRVKLKAVRSAHVLSSLAELAGQYTWHLSVDPTRATAKDMQQLLRIIRRLVERGSVTDEFDIDSATGQRADPPKDFGVITRLARLQELINALLKRGVGVLVGMHFNKETILEIQFVPRVVESVSRGIAP